MKHLSRRVPLLVMVAMLCLATPGYGALVAPVGTTTAVGDPAPAFAWTAVAGATPYTFELDSGNTIGTPLKRIDEEHAGGTDQAIADGPYTWRVRAVTAAGNGPWSNPVNWSKAGTGPTLVSPAANATVTYPTRSCCSGRPSTGPSSTSFRSRLGRHVRTPSPRPRRARAIRPALAVPRAALLERDRKGCPQGNPVGTTPSDGTGSQFTWAWPLDRGRSPRGQRRRQLGRRLRAVGDV